MVKLFSLKSPDEWATTKQACRDTYVVTCFLPSTIGILALLYVLSTVFQTYLYIYKKKGLQFRFKLIYIIDLMSIGKSFQSIGAITEKALKPYVFKL